MCSDRNDPVIDEPELRPRIQIVVVRPRRHERAIVRTSHALRDPQLSPRSSR